MLNLHQAANASLNGLFTFVDYTLAPEDSRITDVLYVRGSFLTKVYGIFRTQSYGGATLVRVMYGAETVAVSAREQVGRDHQAHVIVTDETSGTSLLDTWVGTDEGEVVMGGIKVEMRAPLGDARSAVQLVINNGAWQYTVTPGTHRLVATAARRMHVDVLVSALTDPLAAFVAPHGLIGQGGRQPAPV